MIASSPITRPPALLPQTSMEKQCSKFLKITFFVIGILAVTASISMYFHHINAIATYSTGLAGFASIATATILAIYKHYYNYKISQNYKRYAQIKGESIQEERECRLTEKLKNQSTEQQAELLINRITNKDVRGIQTIMKEGVDPLSTFSCRLEDLPAKWPAICCVFESLSDKSLEMLKLMLSDQDVKNIRNGQFNNYTLLHHAVHKRGAHITAIEHQRGIVQFLIKETNVDVNAQDAQGRTPLHQVVSYASNLPPIDLIALLVENGADWDIADQSGVTPRQALQQNLQLAHWQSMLKNEPELLVLLTLPKM